MIAGFILTNKVVHLPSIGTGGSCSLTVGTPPGVFRSGVSQGFSNALASEGGCSVASVKMTMHSIDMIKQLTTEIEEDDLITDLVACQSLVSSNFT
jgi:hypothetical protein